MYSKSAPRRRHSAEFKTHVLAASDEPGASISAVALAHGLNANLLRKWRLQHGTNPDGAAPKPSAKLSASTRPVPVVCAPPGGIPFLAIEMPFSEKTSTQTAAQDKVTAVVEPVIHVELRRGPLHLSVRWPSAAANDCTVWLRELTSGLLK